MTILGYFPLLLCLPPPLNGYLLRQLGTNPDAPPNCAFFQKPTLPCLTTGPGHQLAKEWTEALLTGAPDQVDLRGGRTSTVSTSLFVPMVTADQWPSAWLCARSRPPQRQSPVKRCIVGKQTACTTPREFLTWTCNLCGKVLRGPSKHNLSKR